MICAISNNNYPEKNSFLVIRFVAKRGGKEQIIMRLDRIAAPLSQNDEVGRFEWEFFEAF